MFCGVSGFTAGAQIRKIPAEVTDSFTDKYPEAKAVEWKDKLTGFSAAEAYMATTGAPAPSVAAAIAVVMELGVGVLLAVGLLTRPLALLLALYTLGTALIGHHFWTQTGMEQYANMVNFYKNISIIGGLLLLAVTGPGKYSFDKR